MDADRRRRDDTDRPAAIPSTERRAAPRRAAALGGIDPDTLAPPLRDLVSRLAAEVDRLTGEVTARGQRITELERLADEDPLVPALNRRGLRRDLERAIAYVARYRTPAALVYVDLDGFKALNDEFGHAAGDAALAAVADVLRAQVRASDVIGRIGGDEFAVILWHAEEADAVRRAESLAAAVAAASVEHQGRAMRLSASAGATAIHPDDTVDAVLARADQAMYAAKRRGR